MTKWTTTGGWPDRQKPTNFDDGKCNECDGEGITEDGDICDYCGGTGEE